MAYNKNSWSLKLFIKFIKRLFYMDILDSGFTFIKITLCLMKY